MKKTVTVIVSVLLIAALAVSLTACGASLGVRKTLSAFQKACNALDVEAALNCVDPAVSGLFKLGAGFIGAISGQTREEIFTQLSSALGAHADTMGVESFKTLKIRVNKVTTQDISATAAVTLTYMTLSGEETTRDAAIRLKSNDKTWYITGIDF